MTEIVYMYVQVVVTKLKYCEKGKTHRTDLTVIQYFQSWPQVHVPFDVSFNVHKH